LGQQKNLFAFFHGLVQNYAQIISFPCLQALHIICGSCFWVMASCRSRLHC